VIIVQSKVLLHTIKHCTATGMNAEMVNSFGKVGHISLRWRDVHEASLFGLRAQIDGEPVGNRPCQLAHWKNTGSKPSEIVLHCTRGNCNYLLRKSNTTIAIFIRSLNDSPMSLVVGDLDALSEEQLVLCSGSIRAAAREQQSRTTTAEEDVLQQHGLFVAFVEIG